MIGCGEVVTDEGQNGTFLTRIGSRASRAAAGAAVPSRYHSQTNGRNARNILEVGHLARGLKQVPMWALVRSSLR